MRYEDWDVLLFPTGEDSKVPIKEFKVACHVVHDVEFTHTHQSPGIPTLCCFVPSLTAGTPFQVSMHSWNPPAISQFTQSCTSFSDSVMFQARLFIDGQLVASTGFDRQCDWPHVLAHSFEFSKNSDFEPLKFPDFRQELLHQDHWSPADDLGRIKIVLSEGFPRDSFTMPVERVKNIVAFSFQHAPLDILEGSAIAWPNQSMWQRVPYIASKPVPTLTADSSDLHAHSPRRRTHQDYSNECTLPVLQKTSATKGSMFPSGRGNIGLPINFGGESLPGVNTYFDWLHPMAIEEGNTEVNNGGSHAAVARKCRKSSTDTTMPDYVSLGGHKSDKSDNIFGSFPIHEDDDTSLGSMATVQAPMNTPTSAQSLSFASGSKIPVPWRPSVQTDVRHTETVFPSFTSNHCFPSDLAESLTASLLNQPAPAKAPHAGHPPATEVKSRKENRPQGLDLLSPSIRAGSFHRPEKQGTRKVEQQTRVSTSISLPASTDASATNSPRCIGARTEMESTTRKSSSFNVGGSLASEFTPDNALRAVSGNSDKANKRGRSFPLASSKAIDEADEPRGSPRLRLTLFEEIGHGDLS